VSPVWITSPVHVSRQARTDWRRRRSVAFAVCFTVLTSFASSATAQQSKPEEYQVKAVYLYNFGRFIDWPATGNKDDSFTICVLGRDPFGAVLDATLAGETIGDKKLVARRLASTLDGSNCKILFISSSESSRMKQILAAVEKFGVLTVSDLPDFAINGGMIQFVLRDNKVRFEVNLAAAERAGLTLSSQLLKVATDVMQ